MRLSLFLLNKHDDDDDTVMMMMIIIISIIGKNIKMTALFFLSLNTCFSKQRLGLLRGFASRPAVLLPPV